MTPSVTSNNNTMTQGKNKDTKLMQKSLNFKKNQK